MSLLVVGTVALDSVRTPFGEVRDALGGSATFAALAASYFTDVAVVAVVGSDFPEEHLEFLALHGIDTAGIATREGETMRWAGVYGYDLNDRDTIETRLNVFKDFRPVIPPELRGAGFLFLANMDPLIQQSVLEQMEGCRLVALDTMNFWIEGKNPELKEALRRVDLLVLNDSECRQLAEEPNLIKAAKQVQRMGPANVVVKKGEHGAVMLCGDRLFFAPAYPCETVFDPTGAGDTFAGGMLGSLLTGSDLTHESLRRAVIYGTVMASFCVERFSVEGLDGLSHREIEGRARLLREITSFGL